jgi:hypothetical protein
MVSTELKRCPRCGEDKPLTAEHFYRRARGGWAGYCKPCVKAKAVAWQQRHPEKKRASDAKQNRRPERRAQMRERLDRWATGNPERAREMRRANYGRWREAHPEAAAAAAVRYRKTPKGKLTEARARAKPGYREAHKIRARMYRATLEHQVYDAARRTRRGFPGAERHLTLPQWNAILTAFGGACAYCGDATRRPEIDHVLALTRGGAHAADNVLPACRSCNSRKRVRGFEEFCTSLGLVASSLLVRRDAALAAMVGA